ncbi:hypothetical protein [Streptomyces sp. NPDC058045]|uniref:hypothetical protein n=1 Tax=Streptomyces sp. NPDC058045 TaxID=3346311 RepID=UPI0036E8076F
MRGGRGVRRGGEDDPEPGLGTPVGPGAGPLVVEPVAQQVPLAGRTLDTEASRACGLVPGVVPDERVVDAAPGARPEADGPGWTVPSEGVGKRERMDHFLLRRRNGTAGRCGHVRPYGTRRPRDQDTEQRSARSGRRRKESRG